MAKMENLLERLLSQKKISAYNAYLILSKTGTIEEICKVIQELLDTNAIDGEEAYNSLVFICEEREKDNKVPVPPVDPYTTPITWPCWPCPNFPSATPWQIWANTMPANSQNAQMPYSYQMTCSNAVSTSKEENLIA